MWTVRVAKVIVASEQAGLAAGAEGGRFAGGAACGAGDASSGCRVRELSHQAKVSAEAISEEVVELARRTNCTRGALEAGRGAAAANGRSTFVEPILRKAAKSGVVEGAVVSGVVAAGTGGVAGAGEAVVEAGCTYST